VGAATAVRALSPAAAQAAAAPMGSRILSSEFLSSDHLPPGQQLAVILLNWTLPNLTPRLWHKGDMRTATIDACSFMTRLPNTAQNACPILQVCVLAVVGGCTL
jgi:hypothetical protein